MAQPVIWPKKTFFYPIGNTPPVCLTQGLSPEKKAHILLLACGDPRSILYTVYADLADGNRSLDFTCCDWEPAVLARNILLLTMIVDGVSANTAWSIFYHFFLDEATHDVLIAQCRTLIQTSSDMKTWKFSKYGNFLRFCTEFTLLEIRRHWSLYAESKDLSQIQRRSWKASFLSEMKSIRENRGGETMTAMRAAGPLFLSIIEEGPKSYTSFWSTGVTKTKSSKTTATPFVNPTFSYSLSGKKFNVHYGTDPITAFFLAPALASGKSGKPSSSITVEDLVDCAKSQFTSWFLSFRMRLTSASTPNIVIRFFLGESLAFCHALHACKEQNVTQTGVYAHPWGGTAIELETGDYSASSASRAPLLFNVIETSNLADHAGLLNLLVVTVPLLDRKPWANLHTNTLLRSTQKGPAKSVLAESAFSDIPTLCLLLGVAPSAHLWHFTPHSNKHEIITSNPTSGQLLESISWHFVSSFAFGSLPNPQDVRPEPFVLLCDAVKLGKFFFFVYMRMFSCEDQASNLRNVLGGNLSGIKNQNLVHYVRSSFVSFLAFVKGSVRVNWAQTMSHFIDLMADDKTFMMGPANYQDVMCHMYLRNIISLDIHTAEYLETVRTTRDRFCGWTRVPPIACVILKIPRNKLQSLETMDPDAIMTPILQCETISQNFHNIHSSIQLTFGDAQVSKVDGEPRVAIRADPKGWDGNSSLIATFYIPSWILCAAPTSTQVGLHIRSTPSSIMKLIPKLGPQLTIFSAPLTDTEHVHVVRNRPNNSREIEYLRNTPAYSTSMSSGNPKGIMVKFDISGEKVTHLIIRKDIIDARAARLLTSGSEVSVTPIADSVVLATFGDQTLRFAYPFPVQMDRLQTRIARKSSYIEIECPIRPEFNDSAALSLNPFAVAHDGENMNILNVHYVNLDILPALSLPGKEKDLQWLSVHGGMMFSKAEKQTKGDPDQEKRGTLANLKESIGCILLNYAGLQLQDTKKWSSIFGLNDPHHGGIYTLIFVNAMKLDLASHTVALDACVVPLTDKIMPKLEPGIQKLVNHRFIQVVTLEDEKRTWKLLLPVIAERCRTWKHTDTCEYRTSGVPVSVEGSERSPLCSCGKGKNLGRFGTLSDWKLFHGEATRVAIGPLFTFSFMEELSEAVGNSVIGKSTHKMDKCAKCGGPGKPNLLLCSVCKVARYCSRDCQKAHWKIHKKSCTSKK